MTCDQDWEVQNESQNGKKRSLTRFAGEAVTFFAGEPFLIVILKDDRTGGEGETPSRQPARRRRYKKVTTSEDDGSKSHSL